MSPTQSCPVDNAHRIGADDEVQITAAGCDGANGCWFRVTLRLAGAAEWRHRS
jgi:hypothetical protein